MSQTIIKRCFIKGKHSSCFRPGEPAEIIGMKYVQPEGFNYRLCYLVLYPDGVTDLIPKESVEDPELYLFYVE